MTYYVYTLTDPLDGEVFYVGKGAGRRMHHHAARTRRGLDDGNPRKFARIRAIQDAGLEPRAEVVSLHSDEQEALEREAELIASLKGLTNILAGAGWAITEEERERRQTNHYAKAVERERAALRRQVQVWDEWERRGYTFSFPNLSGGEAKAREYVRIVREMAA